MRERAYRAGDLASLEKEERSVRERLNAATREIRVLRRLLGATQTRINELDAQIIAASALDTKDIRAILATPRLGHFQHGEFTGELVRVLRAATGPLATRQIIGVVVDKFGLPYHRPEDREATRRRVVERLRVLARKGAIERMHDTASSGQGLWRWKGL